MTVRWRIAQAAAVLVVCLLIGATTAFAQVTSGSVTGTVKDPQGGTYRARR